MKAMLIPFLIAIVFLAPSTAWELRGSIYPVEDGIVEWNQESFSGFTATGSESLKFNISNEHVNAGDASYKASIYEKSFAHSEWGHYLSLSFLGREYFVGYPEDCRIAESMNLLSLNNGSLGQILMDSSEWYTFASDEELTLQDGYSLRLSDAEDGVKVSLYKERTLIDSQILLPPADFVYKSSMGNENATHIAARIEANARLLPKSYYTVIGLFQLSEELQPIYLGMNFGEMQISKISDGSIEMNNKEDLSLARGRNFELMEGIRVRTSENNATFNQLCIFRNSTEMDTPQIRGEIARESFSWNPRNFAGFYYDMNEDLGREEITTSIDDDNIIDIIYTTESQQRSFDFAEWGKYDAISFFGERCLAGYEQDSLLGADSDSVMNFGKIGWILLDSSEPFLIADGSELIFEEGISAKFFIDRPCNSTLIELFKNGEMIDRDYFQIPNTYQYKKAFEESYDGVTILGIHIEGIDCPRREVLVNGIFQISEDLIDVGEGYYFDKMDVCAIYSGSEYGIEMCNQDKIILGKSLDTSLAGSYHIKAMEGVPLKYYIYKPA